MSFHFIFAPRKLLYQTYNTFILEKTNCSNGSAFYFDKFIENEVGSQICQEFINKNVKMIGYDYIQYDENQWSYYPVQLVVSNRNIGIIWIKWTCGVPDYYFVFDAKKKNDFKYLPVVIEKCTIEESIILTHKYTQPCFKYDICNQKYIQFSPSANWSHNLSFTFCYELQRQMSNKFQEITEDVKISNKLVISFVGLGNVIDYNGFTYTYIGINPKPFRQRDQDLLIEIKWQSQTHKTYISPSDVISIGDVIFDFSDIIPMDDAKLGKIRIANKDEILELIRTKPIASWLLD